MQNYKDIKKIAFENDTNCCTVISASIIFDKDYNKIHSYFAENGRKNGEGLSWSYYKKLIRNLAKKYGFKVYIYKLSHINKNTWTWKSKENESLCFVNSKTGLTVNNFNDYLPKGNYLLGVKNHVLAVKNNIVHDWTADKKKPITEIIKVESNEKVKECNFSKFDFSKF